ncbi:hypothetical protein [Micromonospora sp. NPDC050200]|uniref:hypothetical protein n=1 Tax=Micromonospora sp. NPDC050200 TaxID=3155664 RepID=UPI0033EEC8AF
MRSFELVCQPDLMPFYWRWGFTEQVGHSGLMRRTADPRLTGTDDRSPAVTGDRSG